MSEFLRPVDPKRERVNVPGTIGAGNWSYRLPAMIDDILADKKLAAKARALSKIRNIGGRDRLKKQAN